MKKLILTICFCFVASVCGAEEYWCNVRLEDRSGLTQHDDKTRSKRGDVISCTKTMVGQSPTITVQKEYLIVKVDLTKQQMIDLTSRWMEKVGERPNGSPIMETRAYRRNKLDITKLEVADKRGYVPTKIESNKIEYSQKTFLDISKYEWKRKYFAYIQHPFNLVMDKVIPKARAAASTSKICAVGGNCTDEDYNNIADWEDAKDGVLDGIQTAEVYNDDGDITSTGVTEIGGSTTGASDYMKITVIEAERHNGTDNDAATLYMTATASWENGGITVTDGYTVIEWLIIISDDDRSHSQWGGVFLGGGSDFSEVRNNIFQHVGTRTASHGPMLEDTGSLKLYNNVIYDIKSCVFLSNCNTAQIYNNTVDGCSHACFEGASYNPTVTMKNNITKDCGGHVLEESFLDANSIHNIFETANAETADGVVADSGTADTNTLNHLIQTGQNFETTVEVGYIVKNTTDTTYGYVTVVNSDTDLTLASDLVPDGDENYTIYKQYIRSVVFENEGTDYHLDAAETIAIDGGTDLGTGTFSFDIDNGDRDSDVGGALWDMGADEFVAAAPPAEEAAPLRRRIMVF